MALALVAYADSDIEDSDDDDIQDIPKPVEKEIQIKQEDDKIKLFASLPLPKQKMREDMHEDDDVFLHKKEKVPAEHIKPQRNPVKITIPSLSKIPDTKPMSSADVTVQIKNTTRLLSMLPEPKFSKTLPDKTENSTFKFIPRTVNTTKPAVSTPAQIKNTTAKALVNMDSYGSDDSDTEEAKGSEKNLPDFFSLNAEHNEPVSEIKEEVIVGKHSLKVQNVTPYDNINENQYDDNPPQVPLPNREAAYNEDDNSMQAGSSTNGNDPMQLDEEAILKLIGRKGRHKRGDVQIIDIDQKEILPDSREWLLKAMTEDNSKRVSCKRRGDEPTHVQKRKHQITYLAHQAKANEIELQNQWSNNRMSRKQTQSKYGF